jgi:hypothetical protein
MSQVKSNDSTSNLALVGYGMLLGWAFYNVSRRLSSAPTQGVEGEQVNANGEELHGLRKTISKMEQQFESRLGLKMSKVASQQGFDLSCTDEKCLL